jgi:hypothetical protein
VVSEDSRVNSRPPLRTSGYPAARPGELDVQRVAVDEEKDAEREDQRPRGEADPGQDPSWREDGDNADQDEPAKGADGERFFAGEGLRSGHETERSAEGPPPVPLVEGDLLDEDQSDGHEREERQLLVAPLVVEEKGREGKQHRSDDGSAAGLEVPGKEQPRGGGVEDRRPDEQHVVGEDRPGHPRERRERHARQDDRGVGHDVGPRRVQPVVGEEARVAVEHGVLRPTEEPDDRVGVTPLRGPGGHRMGEDGVVVHRAEGGGDQHGDGQPRAGRRPS